MGNKGMKFFKKIFWFVLGISIVLLAYVLLKFEVDDMTLSKGEVYPFDSGWSLVFEDGSSIAVEELPYLGESRPGETVVMKNTIPDEFWGMSMSFLSADKVLRVWIDKEIVYEFGVADKRSFGRTPGSVVNFIDIPAQLTTGEVCIEMVSPYENYAASINSITVGKRDILILKLLTDNIGNIVCSFIIIVCGIGFALLFLIRRVSRQNDEGMQYVCGYCIVAAVYYFIETKTMHIFYGNQTLYSVLVFVCLMLMPFLLLLYYVNGILEVYRKRLLVLLGLVCVNIFAQIILQLFNILDFMHMAFISHALIMTATVMIAKSYFDIIRQKHSKSLKLEMSALFFMGLGGTVDILRMYMIGVGDMGKFSRWGTAAFGILLLYRHFRQMIMGYAYNIEKNAKLLAREIEMVEKKNEELKKANEQAEEARKKALAADVAKGKFLAHMSHEIRTPINAVLGMDTMILRETKDMQIKEYALDIQNAGQNLLALINDILDFSKIESGKMEVVPVEYDVSSLIHDISNMILVKVQAKKLAFEVYVDEELPSKLLGDDMRIRQVVVNLLNNAVKYTHEGTVTLRIGGKVQNGKAILDFSVEDTGIGIKEEDIAKLFEEFERIEEKRNRNIEGTGLGINITTQLLLLMGSRLQVESEYGKGSRFYFTLEQEIVDDKPVGDLEERIRQQKTEYDYMAVFTAPEAQILVVDDNAINLKVFISLLKNTKVNVDIANGGRACLDMVSRKHYDLIFLDHMMPDLDGIETLHEMKKMADNQCKDAPVVALTANVISGAKEMYLAEGFDAFLSKPVNPEKLEQMILRLLPRELLVFETEERTEDGTQKFTAEENEGIIGNDITGEAGCLAGKDGQEQEELPIVDGVDWSYGLLHLPSKELLVDTVEDFYKTIDSEADALEDFYHRSKREPDMLDQYRIKVHSMKSSANLIGATVLGGMAKLLENAAKAGDRELIDRLTDIFLVEWRSYKEKLKSCIGADKEAQEKETVEDYHVILAYLEMLRVAMLDMDIDKMDETMDRLEAYEYPQEIQTLMERLAILVTELDGDAAEPVMEELMKLMNMQIEGRNTI